MDSPVPYVIGMSIETWNGAARAKYEALEHEEPIAVLRFEGDFPILQLPSCCQHIESPSPLAEESFIQSLRLITELTQNKSKVFGDRETKVYLKQVFLNYLLLVLGDLREYLLDGKFDYLTFVRDHPEDSQQFY